MNFLTNHIKNIEKEIKTNVGFYILCFLILIFSLFFRVYRLDQLIGFYYDQGRDALVIWNLWNHGDTFLIGPTTGLAGIFRGPFYYYLIAPFYFLGGGNPVYPSVFLSVTAVFAIALAMYLAKELEGWKSALIAGILSGFSFYMVYSARWLSNPTPMLLVSMLLVFSMFQIIKGRKWYWTSVGLLLGLAMQFGSATEVFYFVSIGLFALWQRKNLPGLKIFLISIGLLLFTFLPQIIFDIRNDWILSGNIKKFLIDDKSFRYGYWEIVKTRFSFYENVFFSKLFPTDHTPWKFTFGLILLSIGLNWKILFADKRFVLLLFLIIAPIVGMLFFQGNHGIVYDYYFTGYYMVFILLISVLLGNLSMRWWGMVLVVVFLSLFWQQNFNLTRNFVSAGVDGQNHITLGNQLQAVNWVINDAKNRGEFNVDAYVPPVIPYAYDYLFLWQTKKQCGDDRCGQVDHRVSLLYTVNETDEPHPERLEAWMARQAGIGTIVDEVRFGGVSVQRRTRISKKEEDDGK